MNTHYYTHSSFQSHDTGQGHPENALRLRAIDVVLNREAFAGLVKKDAPRAEIGQILLAHSKAHTDKVLDTMARYGFKYRIRVSFGMGQ